MTTKANKQTVLTWTPVKLSNPDREPYPELDYQESLIQPEYIEYDGAQWSVKLQDTFLVSRGSSIGPEDCILAIWTIGKYLRDTLETQVKQVLGAAWNYRQNGEFNHAQYQEEVAIAMQRNYPHINTDGMAFKGITIVD